MTAVLRFFSSSPILELFLCHTLIYRHLEVAAVLREAGGRGGVRDHKAALITAAAAGDEHEVRALLDDGANANCADYDKRTVTVLEEKSIDDESIIR